MFERRRAHRRAAARNAGADRLAALRLRQAAIAAAIGEPAGPESPPAARRLLLLVAEEDGTVIDGWRMPAYTPAGLVRQVSEITSSREVSPESVGLDRISPTAWALTPTGEGVPLPLPPRLAAAAQDVWRVWNRLDDNTHPVKTIANVLGLTNADVAAIIYPAPQYGLWDDDQEPDLEPLPDEADSTTTEVY
jgi:hypothetical protein